MTTINNPLLSAPLSGPVPFHLIQSNHFVPAIEALAVEARSKIKSIAESRDQPTLTNTLHALDHAHERLEWVSGIFHNLLHAHANDELQAASKTIDPLLASVGLDVTLNPKLFGKIKTLYESQATLNLTAEEKRWLDETYRGFVRNGAKLPDKEKAELRDIDEEISKLAPAFTEHVLKSTHAFYLHLEKETDLDGVPEGIKAACAETAREKKLPGWVVTLDGPIYLPFMRYAKRRDLREKLWRSMLNRCSQDGEWDNKPIILKMLSLKEKRSKLLGYRNYAGFVLEERMAKSPERVHQFLESLYQKAKPAYEKEFRELEGFAKNQGVSDFMPWDAPFFSERLKEKTIHYDAEKLKQYFVLETTLQGVFEHARRLYGVKFVLNSSYPIYHPEVVAYDVIQEGTGDQVGVFYADFFPRATKSPGAWMTQFKEQSYENGKRVGPHVAIVCNFTKPTATEPSLLTLEEVETLFHEFGHALHGLLSDCKVKSLSGTKVYWDFVELPSQFMENFVSEKESLVLFAKHVKTGETIPDAWVEKIHKVSRFQAAMQMMRQLGFAMLDMAWHSGKPLTLKTAKDFEEFEKNAMAKTTLMPTVSGACLSTSFGHIFGGGYSAGYYSYKWAEVLEADAFEAFIEEGIFNPKTALRFRETVLARGNSEDPAELYRKFRGRDPDPDALLRRDGLL